MPIKSCSSDGQPGYKWGDSGKCYVYSPGSEQSRKDARKKALAQGIASGDISIKNGLGVEGDYMYPLDQDV